jgi:hypothetical protein
MSATGVGRSDEAEHNSYSSRVGERRKKEEKRRERQEESAV